MENLHDALLFFRSDVLHIYTGRPDKYRVEFVSYGRVGGCIHSVENDAFGGRRGINICFALRELPDNELAVAVFSPDFIQKTDLSERSKWECFLLDPSAFADYPDPDFDKWALVHLKGEWADKTPPLRQLIDQVRWANAISQSAVGCSIFSFHHDELIRLPVPFANHTHAYEDTHRELYRYFPEGINKNCLRTINTNRGINIPNFDEMRNFKALEHSFPILGSSLVPTLKTISKNRGDSVHGRRSDATPFPALKQFLADLENLAYGIGHLVCVMEQEFNIGRERARALVHLPRHNSETVGDPQIDALSNRVGLTIREINVVVFNEKEEAKRDALLLTFEDGSQIAITFHANAKRFLDKETPQPSELCIEFTAIEQSATSSINTEYDEMLVQALAAQGIIGKLPGRELTAARLYEVIDAGRILPRRQVLFLDLDDGSNVVIEPTWNLGHRVKKGLVDLSSGRVLPEDIHLQLLLYHVPPL